MERGATHSHGDHRKDTLSVPSFIKTSRHTEGSLRDTTLLVPSTDTSSRHFEGSHKIKPSSNLTSFHHEQHRSSRSKTNLRRCASVDVAELHREQKKSSKTKSKSKVDKEKLLSKQDEEILSKWLDKDEKLFKEFISSKKGDSSDPKSKRPDSLKLSSIFIIDSKGKKSSVLQNSINGKQDQRSKVRVTVSAFPSPDYRKSRKEKDEQKSDVKVHEEKPSSQRKTPKKVSTDIQADRSANKQADRMDKVAVDFAKTDDVPSEFYESVEGYRKHGLKHNFPSAPYIKIRPPTRQNICMEILGLAIYSIFAFLVFFPMAAFLLVLFPFCCLLKKISSCCCCCSMNRYCCCCNCGEIVSYSERYWLQDYHSNPLIVQSILVIECGLDQHQIQNLINARVVVAVDSAGERLYPRFTQKLSHSCCQYVWAEDRNFLIQNHIYTMPRGIESLEDLQDYVSEMASRPLSYASPLWEVQIIPNFGQHRDTILLFRMHPCMADGISMVKILYKSIADVDSVTTIPPKLAQRSSADIFKSVFYGPLTFFCKILCCTNDFNLLHGKYLHQSGKRVLTWSEPVSMSAAIRIKQVTRSTLNEVLVSVASGCIRNYLKLNGIPNPYDMKCIIPVFFGKDLEKCVMGNKILLLQVPLPTNTEGTVPRLWQMKKNMDSVRRSSLFSVTFNAFRFTNLLLPDSLWHSLWNYFFNRSTCFVSSLPGPEICLRLASKQIRTVFYWFPPVQKVALSISFFTYSDQLQMAVSADRSVLPNPEVLTKDFIFQMETLVEQLAHRRLPGEHISKKPDLALISNEVQPEQTTDQIQLKMALIQEELLDLKVQLECTGYHKNIDSDVKLITKIETLKEQFRELLVELRRRKAAELESAVLVSEEESTEDEDEFEVLRGRFRRRAMSVSSRLSTTSMSSSIRPLAATPVTPDAQDSPQLSNEKHVPYRRGERNLPPSVGNYVGSLPRPSLSKDKLEILELSYSPSLERKFRKK